MNASEQYKEHEIGSAGQGRLIVMMYEGAIRFLDNALEALQARRLDRVNEQLIRAQDVVHELSLALNFDAGDLANQLFGLYSYMNKRLVEANIHKVEEPIHEVKALLEKLKESWAQISKTETEKDGIPLGSHRALDIST